MPRHHCKADDTHVEWVSCLGNPTLMLRWGCLLSLRVSCLASLCTRVALFQSPTPPLDTGCERHDLVRCEWKWIGWQPWMLQTRKSYRALWLTLPSCCHLPSRNARLRADESSSVLWRGLSTSSGLNGLRLRSHLAAGWTSGFFRGAIRPSANARPPSFPEYTTSSRNRDAPPYSSRRRKGTQAPASSGWICGRHISCPPTAIGWKARASHPSKPCRAPSALAGHIYSAAGQAACALHSMVVLQVFQAKMLANEEAGLDTASLRDLRSATDLALRATKVTAQAIGRTMSSLIVLERHLWLTMMEMKEADKVPSSRSGFVRQPVWTSCGGLCWTLHGGLEVILGDATLSSLSAPALPRPAPTQQTG